MGNKSVTGDTFEKADSVFEEKMKRECNGKDLQDELCK